MEGPGTTPNIVAALCSFFVPGLGQLVQGRPVLAVGLFVAAWLMWFILLGWIIHLFAIVDAARFRPAT